MAYERICPWKEACHFLKLFFNFCNCSSVVIPLPTLSALWPFLIPYLLQYLQEDVSTLTPLFTSTRPLYCLGPQVSQGLGASSLTEARPGSPLLYMCWGLHIRWGMLPSW